MDAYPFNHTGFQAHLNQQRLVAARCTHCGSRFLPPRPLCSNCFHHQMEWQALSGAGHLTGFTTIHIGLPAMIAEGYNAQNPYCSGVVRLEEGPAVSAQIMGVDSTRPETIRVGMPLRAVFIPRGPGAQAPIYLAFVPADGDDIDT
jgi:uncharacterized protein